MRTNKDERILSVDIMRGICIYLVVLGHLLEKFYSHTYIWNYIYFFHMPAFFMLSGYLMGFSERKHSISELLILRIRRLLIPFLTWSLVAAAANFLGLILTKDISWNMAASRCLYSSFVEANSLWFFLVLFFIECWFIIIKFISELFAHGICVLRVVLYVFSYALLLLIDTELFKIQKVKVYIPFFILGYLFCWHRGRRQVPCYLAKSSALLRTTLPFCVFAVYSVGVYICGVSSEIFLGFCNFRYSLCDPLSINLLKFLLYFVGVLGTVMIYYMSGIVSSAHKIAATFSSVGKRSYLIYPIHMFITNHLNFALPISDFCFVLWYIIYAAIIVAAIVISLRIVTSLVPRVFRGVNL